MTISLSDLAIRISDDTWTLPESIGPYRYTPPRAMAGRRVHITNNTSREIEWITIDAGLMHSSKRTIIHHPRESDQRKIEETTSGMEVVAIPCHKLRAGATVSVPFPPSQYPTPPGLQNWAVLRLYGKCDGQTFIHHIAHGYMPPVTITNKDKWCFIANAAFEDPAHPIVQELRYARDEILRKHIIGRRFIVGYYKVSPKIANAMQSRPVMRAMAKATLTPIGLAVRVSRKTATNCRLLTKALKRLAT